MILNSSFNFMYWCSSGNSLWISDIGSHSSVVKSQLSVIYLITGNVFHAVLFIRWVTAFSQVTHLKSGQTCGSENEAIYEGMQRLELLGTLQWCVFMRNGLFVFINDIWFTYKVWLNSRYPCCSLWSFYQNLISFVNNNLTRRNTWIDNECFLYLPTLKSSIVK